MKKLVLVVAVAVLGMLACKKKVEEPAPEVKKYVYTRTSGDVTQIVGDIFVDTGGTVFTVKGKNFDPKKRKYYHLLMGWVCETNTNNLNINGWSNNSSTYTDTASLINITDSTIIFKVNKKEIYSVRSYEGSRPSCSIKDTVALSFAVTSKDSTNKLNITTRFDVLKEKKVRNKLFFNILKDTLHWYRNVDKRDTVLTLDDIKAGANEDRVEVYFNSLKLKTGSTASYCFLEFKLGNPTMGDGLFLFNSDFYNDNKDLGLANGFYTITMKEKRTGLPIEERHGKKGIYVKFVD